MNITHNEKVLIAREIARERANAWYARNKEAVQAKRRQQREERGPTTEREREISRETSRRYYARKKAARKEVAV